MTIVNPKKFGVSFSAKQCRKFGIDSEATLDWLINEAGFRRFRLMSYWDEIEAEEGTYNFAELDRQIKQVSDAGGKVTLALGARQPRWPENHWPQWAWEMDKSDRSIALMHFIHEVINRYKDEKCVVSYQLENEALLKNFGRRAEIDRARLREEFELIKQLDPQRPIIMSTSTSWGIPVRQPIPDIVGFSYYQIVYNYKQRKYTTAFHNPPLHKFRAFLIKLIHRKPVFIHELQLEPWGPRDIWEMTREQQDESMSPAQIHKNVSLAKRVGHYPIDLWGGEWWYWRTNELNDSSTWNAVKQAITD